MLKLIHIILFFAFALTCFAQSSSELLQDADRNYLNQDYIAAEELYRKARQEESNLASNFNLGNSTYKQERYEEAIEHYLNATRKSTDKLQNSSTYYNLGNAYFQNQKLEEAIEAYKQAIRLNPANDEAKYNLAYCKEIKKMMEQQQQDQQEQQQQQDQENSEQQEQDQNQEQQEQENQDQQQSDQEQENQQDQEQQESEQDSTSQQDMQQGNFDSTRLEKQTLDSLDAAKLLQIIQSEEQKVQEKLRKFNSNRKKPDKDW